MSELDIVPGFSDGPVTGAPVDIVPAEWESPEQAIDHMVGKPEATPERLRTRMNPEGKAPRVGMGVEENRQGAFRTGTIAGMMTEAGEIQDVASGGEVSARGGFTPAQLAQMPSSVRARIEAEAADPIERQRKLDDSEDSFYAQVAYDNSASNLSVSSVVGTLIGSLQSPESLGGISGLLVKQFGSLASRPVLTAGIDAAAVNTLTDPLVQGGRVMSGGQEAYDPAQTALAPVIGFGLGAGVRGAIELPSVIRERAERAVAGQPEPLVEAPAAEPVPAAPAGQPQAPAVEVPDQAVARAVDEAMPELPRAPEQASASPEAGATAAPEISAPVLPPRVAEATRLRETGLAVEPERTLYADVSDAKIKAHPDYAAAKSGDQTAAGRMIADEITPEMIGSARERFGQDVHYIPVLAEEKAGRNVIPLAMAERLAKEAGGEVELDIIQTNRAYHTGAGPMERLIARTEFDGAVQPGRKYVIVDDVTVMGSTLADLAHHIQVNGGRVEGVVTLANASRSGVLKPSKAQITAIERRFGDALSELFHLRAAGLTADEAKYILNFRDADALRAKVASSVGERQQRLAAKADGGTRDGGAGDNGLVFRKGGRSPAQQLPSNQVLAGRPIADQAAPRPEVPTRLVRVEDISRGLVDAFSVLGREGRVTPGAQGQYSTRTGTIRVKSVADLDTVAHEVGHSFHLYDAKADVDRLVRDNRAELQTLGAGDKAGDQEAFAELFRLFTINRPYAERTYPQSAAALDTLLRDKFPDQYRALDELRAAMDDLYRAPSGEVITADTMQTPPPRFGDGLREALAKDYDPSGRTLYSAFDALYTSVIDKTHPVWKAVENLKAIAAENGNAIDLKPVDDAYIMARMLPGSHGAAGVMLEHGVIPAGSISPQGPSLGDALEKALGKVWDEKGFSEFGAYLVARRMVAEYTRFFDGEIPNPPGKFSQADYIKAVAEFEAAHPQFADAATDVYGFLTNHLQRAYDKGLFSKEYLDAALSRADYVPFVRDMADFAEPVKVGEGGGAKGLRYSLMKAFKGSQRSVQNPLESIFKRVHDLEFAIAQNDAIGALARLSEIAGPGSGAIAEPIPSNQLRGQRVDVIDALKAAGRAANIDDADLKALILQAEDQLGDSTWSALFRQEPIAPGAEPIVFHWVNGERRALRLADGRFGQELFHALNAMSDVEKNWFASILQISQQVLRAGVTKALDFIMVNFIRDQFTAAATAPRRYIPFISALRGAVDAITKTDDAVTYAGFGGMAGGAITEAIDRAEFGRNVGALERAGVIRNMMAGDVLGSIGSLARVAAKGLELSEAGTRMGLYKAAFAQAKGLGFDDLNAATYAAFKATDYVDFRKAGASMNWLRRWVPFLNAALQGTDREFRAIADLPVLELKRSRGETLSSTELDRLKDARVAMVRVMGMGAILGTGLAVLNADEPEYQSAPEFTKRTNFLIRVGDTWLAIPKPFGVVQSVVNAFETAADSTIRKDPSLWGDWLEGSLAGFAPPTNNPLIGLVYDLPANYNRFRDRPIVPYYLQGVKPSEQYNMQTSEIAKFMGSVTGWSPMKVDYAISNLGGSNALNLLKAGDLLIGTDRPEAQIYDWPVARRFVKNLARGNQATTQFYNLVGDKNGKYEQAENAYRTKIRNGERTGAAEYLRGLPADERAWATLQSLGFDATAKRLHPMQNAKDRIGVISGVASQLNLNNLIKEDDLDRRDLTRSRRDAAPINLNKTTRARLIENFQELQMVTARNAMITVGAKGTAGLKVIDTVPVLERIRALSSDAYEEYEARVESKKVYDAEDTFKAWPEMKSRLLRDGENADVRDLLPPGTKVKRRKRR